VFGVSIVSLLFNQRCLTASPERSGGFAVEESNDRSWSGRIETTMDLARIHKVTDSC